MGHASDPSEVVALAVASDDFAGDQPGDEWTAEERVALVADGRSEA